MKKKKIRKKLPDEEDEYRPSIEEIFPHEFWLEKYGKQEHFVPKIFDHFVPNLKNTPITIKFYSKYEQFRTDKNHKIPEKYVQMVNLYVQGGPRERYSMRICENHNYGWYSKPLSHYDQSDLQRFMKPRVKGELSTFAEKLVAQRVTERPSFHGTVFKVY